MSIAPASKEMVKGQSMLEKLPALYFSILKSTLIEQESKSSIRCSIEFPGIGRRSQSASSAKEAIRALLVELTMNITERPELLQSITPPYDLSNNRALDVEEKTQRFKSKARQLTIGVTMPIELKIHLTQISENENTSFADIARQYTSIGFESFDERVYSESSKKLIDELARNLNQWPSTASEQVMIRLDPKLAVRLRSSAQQYTKSASEFGAMCLVQGLILQTQLATLESQVEQYKGAALRNLAPKVGLGNNVVLLSEVLQGSVVAPKKLLSSLSLLFETKEAVLKAFFKRSFELKQIPAYKAENGKPTFHQDAIPWQDAVLNLGLSESEKKILLELE